MDDIKELRQPAGIETKEVGTQSGDRSYHTLGFLPRGEVDRIARIVHEANRAYCIGLGDYTQPSWDDAPDWQRESARLGVDGITSGTITRPSQSHESWLAQKVADGWTYAPEKNAAMKQHPCMVAYDELPASQRMKDHLFFSIVRTLTQDIG